MTRDTCETTGAPAPGRLDVSYSMTIRKALDMPARFLVWIQLTRVGLPADFLVANVSTDRGRTDVTLGLHDTVVEGHGASRRHRETYSIRQPRELFDHWWRHGGDIRFPDGTVAKQDQAELAEFLDTVDLVLHQLAPCEKTQAP